MAYCLTSSCQQQSISPEHGAKRERDKIVTKSVWGKFILPEPLVPKSKPDVWKMVTIVTMSQTRSVDMFFGGECARVKYNYIIFIYIYVYCWVFVSKCRTYSKSVGSNVVCTGDFFLVGGMSTYSKDFVLVVVEHYIYNLNMHDWSFEDPGVLESITLNFQQCRGAKWCGVMTMMTGPARFAISPTSKIFLVRVTGSNFFESARTAVVILMSPPMILAFKKISKQKRRISSKALHATKGNVLIPKDWWCSICTARIVWVFLAMLSRSEIYVYLHAIYLMHVFSNIFWLGKLGIQKENGFEMGRQVCISDPVPVFICPDRSMVRRT